MTVPHRARILRLASLAQDDKRPLASPPEATMACNFLGLVYVKGTGEERKCNYPRLAYPRGTVSLHTAGRRGAGAREAMRERPGEEDNCPLRPTGRGRARCASAVRTPAGHGLSHTREAENFIFGPRRCLGRTQDAKGRTSAPRCPTPAALPAARRERRPDVSRPDASESAAQRNPGTVCKICDVRRPERPPGAAPPRRAA